MNAMSSTTSRSRTTDDRCAAPSAHFSVSMRSLPTLALTLAATLSLAACKRGDKPPLGATDTSGTDTMAAPGALGDIPRNGGDTIAVPPAAVDTTTDRAPGETPRATGAPATGVDTPITKKIGSPAPVKKE